MNLSLSNCNPFSHSVSLPPVKQTRTVWQQLNSTTESVRIRPQLHGHFAVTTVFRENELMVVTGGYESHNANISKFHVLLLNLTHADSFGEEQWLQMDEGDIFGNLNKSSKDISCEPFEFNGTTDVWKRENLWEYSVQCPPSPRRGHMSSVINDYLYVFQGHTRVEFEKDYHIYRISMNDVVSNNWSGWRRILPRKTLDWIPSSYEAIKGGLWYWDENELPRLVGLIRRVGAHVKNYNSKPNQVWLYDFTQDSWELSYEFEKNELLLEDCNAIVVGQHLLVVGSNYNAELQMNWLNLNTKHLSIEWEAEKYIYPAQTLVTYEDAVTKTSAIVGFGPSLIESYPSQLTVSYLQYFKDDSMKLVPVEKSLTNNENPSYRSGHTAVLSSRGNMYIFGGEDLTAENETISRLNVGGKDCALKVHGFFNYINGSIGGELPAYSFESDDTIQEEYDGQGGLFIFFFIIGQFFVCFVPNTRRNEQDGQMLFSSSQGLTEEELDAFPRRILCESDAEISDDDVMCSICLGPFASGDEVRDLPCEHIFHSSCVNDWLANETTCPLCRVSCRPRIENTAPHTFSRISLWLRRDEREPVSQNDNNSIDGVEMGTLS
mmetsp:Transcript_1020/g.1302  ORF Transcript_1020/g.1302 Transcript_1020/m.1302 type:complete len:605 (+) Transcript_1020:105-1919(+)